MRRVKLESATPPGAMSAAHLDELIAVERSYWWHLAKRALVLDLAKRHFPPPRKLVDGGFGGGETLRVFKEAGYEALGLDSLPAAVEHARSLGVAAHVHELEQPWPKETEGAGVVLLLDLLEHMDDPVRVLANVRAVLAPGGGAIVSVPAAPFLMGPWDRMLGHRRRYSARLLREHARQAGFKVAYLSHWNSFSLPAAVLVRLVEKARGAPRSAEFPPVSPLVNGLLVGCARFERSWLRRAPLPCGLSLVGVLRP